MRVLRSSVAWVMARGSVIFEVKNLRSHETFALKHVVRSDDQDKRLIEQVETEFHIAQKVNHPYIRKIHDIQRRKKYLQTREVLMLMEFCPGISLEQSSARSLLDILLIFRMVADGLQGIAQQRSAALRHQTE